MRKIQAEPAESQPQGVERATLVLRRKWASRTVVLIEFRLSIRSTILDGYLVRGHLSGQSGSTKTMLF